MAIDNIARGMAASSSGGGGGGINADIVKGVGIDFEGTDPITIKNTGVTSISESSTNGTINVSNGGKAPVEVPIHGLGSAAYKSENDFLGSDVKYASSDSVGGSANSAKKLANTEAIGSSTNAVYFNENGVPIACTYEVNEDVPSSAKFTDTTYTISTGNSSGEIKITSSDGDEYSVKVKDLNNAAYKDVADSIAENNEKLVSSGLAYTELNKKVDKASVANSVETGNANPVTSGAVYSALTKKADKTIFDVENAGLTPKSTNVNAYLKGDGSWSVPENTTYTISEGSSNGTIKVTSSDEPNKPVSVPVHGLGSAAYKNVDTSVAENSENLITSGAVSRAINELPNPMLFKGSLGTGGTITYLPTATPENEGYTYKVITAGSYSGKTAKVGDVFISNGSEWIIVPSGDEPSGTVTSVGMSVPTGLKIKGGTSPVTTSGTIEVQLDEGYVIPKTADIVPSTRKINGVALKSDVVLDGDDIKTTGYAKAESKSNIAGTDTINQAIGKLEYKADTNETNISTLIERLANVEKRVTTISHVYGFYIDGNNSNPSTRVTYIEDAIGMKPAFMNYETGKFDYGSWGNAWFMPKPCMLKSEGTVAYYLDPMDYSKKIDGTESDISNDDFDGNAMMEWGTGGKKIWTKTVPVLGDPTSCYKYFADEQIDPEYHAYSFIGSDGKMKDHFYTPIYHGSVVGTKLRSLSGKVPCMNKTAQQEIDLATANGNGWYVEQFCDIELINDLLVLMGKSTDTQTVFGKGNSDGYIDDSSINYGMINSGEMNDKGLFWGSNVSSTSSQNGVKVFGMENWWGNQWRRFAGLILDSGTYKFKMGYGTSDGSTTNSYNLTGDGYVSSGITPGGTSGGYINITDYSNGMSLPKTASGSPSTYYCDGLWFDNSIVVAACHGSSCSAGAHCGVFCLTVRYATSAVNRHIGTALSFKSP